MQRDFLLKPSHLIRDMRIPRLTRILKTRSKLIGSRPPCTILCTRRGYRSDPSLQFFANCAHPCSPFSPTLGIGFFNTAEMNPHQMNTLTKEFGENLPLTASHALTELPSNFGRRNSVPHAFLVFEAQLQSRHLLHILCDLLRVNEILNFAMKIRRIPCRSMDPLPPNPSIFGHLPSKDRLIEFSSTLYELKWRSVFVRGVPGPTPP